MLNIGTIVRKYHADESFDDGVVSRIDQAVIVDFYDWIEQWQTVSAFRLIDCWYDPHAKIFEPVVPGKIIKHFHIDHDDSSGSTGA